MSPDPKSPPGFLLVLLLRIVGLLTVATLAFPGFAESPPAHFPLPERGYGYVHDEVKEIPWSIHVFQISRARRDLTFDTTLGNSNQLGMSTVSEQLKTLPTDLGTPLAAVNGDFYVDDPDFPGDPRDLQIRRGELISGPDDHACFWVDATGDLHCTNIISRFQVRWPDGSMSPFGLNQARARDGVVLYTAATSPTLRTRSGTELILERDGDGPWLPLRVGQTLKARVRAVRAADDTPLDRDTLVLSLGSKLEATAAKMTPGTVLQLTTETFPDLTGAPTALGGGPTLVRDGKAREWSGFQMRHPRTAIGWNKEQFFLVQVDGRQGDLSVGMTFPELAAYFVKLGCDQAMNLDGGGSATLWALGQVMNSPSEGSERPGANSLVIVRRKPGPEQVNRRP